MSNRRIFIGTVAGRILSTLLSARAGGQRAKALPRVALVFILVPVADMAGADPANGLPRAFVHGLRDLGLVEGRNVIIERPSTEGRPERMPALMRELVSSRIDVIVTTAPEEARQATDSIPIVALFDNPVYERVIVNLARPERNITGVGSEADPAINAKRLQLLKEFVPKASRVAFLVNFYNPDSSRPLFRPETQTAARALGLTLTYVRGRYSRTT